jgi:endogenous inhibitor of DNA gyrase (YacG/DUF329 family)
MSITLKIECPGCKQTIQWDIKSPYRPFCSPSCKDKDFVGWANEEKVIGGNSVYDDLLSDDLPPEY